MKVARFSQNIAYSFEYLGNLPPVGFLCYLPWATLRRAGQAQGERKRNDAMKLALEKLRKDIARWTDREERRATAIPDLSLVRREEPTAPSSGLYEPSVCVVAQGAKRVILGDDTYTYDAHHYLITSVHLPTIVQIIDASEEKPYLGLVLRLDLREVSQLMVDSNLPAPRAQQASRGMATGEMIPPLLDAFQRLVDLLGNERDIPICPDHPARNPLPSARRRSGHTSAPDRVGRKPEPADRSDDRVAEGKLLLLSARRRPCGQGGHERLDLPPSLPIVDRPESPAIPKTATPAGGQAADACGNIWTRQPRHSRSATRVLPNSIGSTAASSVPRHGETSPTSAVWQSVRKGTARGMTFGKGIDRPASLLSNSLSQQNPIQPTDF